MTIRVVSERDLNGREVFMKYAKPAMSNRRARVGRTIFRLVLAWAVSLLLSHGAHASSLSLETQDLVVSDPSGQMTDERLKVLASQAQETLDQVLALWEVDSGSSRFGKIRVNFEVPRGHDYYTSVFVVASDGAGGRRARVVMVYGFEKDPMTMAHKLTSAVFPHPDKLVRNMMGVPVEERIGNRMSFPGCGLSSDDWALAFLRANELLPISDLGSDHASWGHQISPDGIPRVVDRIKQTKGYVQAGSFGRYLLQQYGFTKLKQFYRLSLQGGRPWKAVFGKEVAALDREWRDALKAQEASRGKNADIVWGMFKQNPNQACTLVQDHVAGP